MCLVACEITYHNFEISLVVFMPNITTNRAITYTNIKWQSMSNLSIKIWLSWEEITKTFVHCKSVYWLEKLYQFIFQLLIDPDNYYSVTF